MKHLANFKAFKTDYLDTFVYFNRDTRRKQLNTLKEDIKELNYVLDYITPKIEDKGICRYLGELKTFRDLREYKTELKYTLRLQEEITNQIINN